MDTTAAKQSRHTGRDHSLDSSAPDFAAHNGEKHSTRSRRGICIWFTGLPSSGKTTLANLVAAKIRQQGHSVSVLDGDIVRTHLSRELGFSRPDREANILRIGFVAAEVVRHDGIAICAAISPYEDTRNKVRQMVGEGNYLEIFVDAPLAVCECRDVKGHYALARSGALANFTGIDSPYERPASPDLRLDTVQFSAEACAKQVVNLLRGRGFL